MTIRPALGGWFFTIVVQTRLKPIRAAVAFRHGRLGQHGRPHRSTSIPVYRCRTALVRFDVVVENLEPGDDYAGNEYYIPGREAPGRHSRCAISPSQPDPGAAAAGVLLIA